MAIGGDHPFVGWGVCLFVVHRLGCLLYRSVGNDDGRGAGCVVLTVGTKTHNPHRGCVGVALLGGDYLHTSAHDCGCGGAGLGWLRRQGAAVGYLWLWGLLWAILGPSKVEDLQGVCLA